MNAPFAHSRGQVRLADLGEAQERQQIGAFLGGQPQATPFHRPEWLLAVARGTGNPALALVAEQGGELTGYLPLTDTHSPLFGRMLASSGFAVGGGLLLTGGTDQNAAFAALEELAARRSA